MQLKHCEPVWFAFRQTCLGLRCMYGAGVAHKFMNVNRRYNGSDRLGKTQYLFM